MGRGMASHTSWRARVTAGGAGWGGAGERVGKEPGRRGHRSQEMGGENAFFHHGATGGSTWSNSGECGPRSVASPRTAAERSWLASAAVTPGGASLQVWECCRARYPPAKPHTGPRQQPAEGHPPTANSPGHGFLQPPFLPLPPPWNWRPPRMLPAARRANHARLPVCPREPRPSPAPKHHGAQSSGQP